jgi:hypothetical protein
MVVRLPMRVAITELAGTRLDHTGVARTAP